MQSRLKLDTNTVREAVNQVKEVKPWLGRYHVTTKTNPVIDRNEQNE